MQHHWIFQLAQPLKAEQHAPLTQGLQQFLTAWKSHGAPVPGEAAVHYNQFIHVQAEPGTTSGCSIDSMTHGVENLLGELGLTHLPANFVFYRNQAGEIAQVDFRELPGAIAKGEMGPETVVFDATLGQSGDFAKWEVTLGESWMSRYLQKV